MKKPYMRTIIGSSGRDCVLIIDGFFQGNLFWVSHYDILPPPTFILEKEPIKY